MNNNNRKEKITMLVGLVVITILIFFLTIDIVESRKMAYGYLIGVVHMITALAIIADSQ